MHICMHMHVYSNIHISRTRVHGFTCSHLNMHMHMLHMLHMHMLHMLHMHMPHIPRMPHMPRCAAAHAHAHKHVQPVQRVPHLPLHHSAVHSMLRVPRGGAAEGVTFYTSSNGGRVETLAADGRSAGPVMANVYCNTADFPSLVSAAAERGAEVFVEVGAGDLRAAAARDVLGKRGAPHVAVAFDRRGADPWRQLLKMAATLISNGATGCQISGLYHPALLAATDAQVNGPPIKKSVKAARKRIEINGRFRGMAADPLRRGSNSPGLPDNRLLATLKRIPTSSLSLVDLTTPGGTPGGSSTSLRELDER